MRSKGRREVAKRRAWSIPVPRIRVFASFRLPVPILLAAALLGGGVAWADDPKAQAARDFRGGSEAYARHDYRTAARLFDEAYRVVPRGAAAYNGGLAWESAEDRARAADDYTRALEAGDLGAVERADATGRLRALEATLARLTFTAPSGTRLVLDDADLAGASVTVHVEPGKHALRVEYADGRAESRALVGRAGVEQAVKLGEASGNAETPAAQAGETPAGETKAEGPGESHDDTPPPHGDHDPARPDRTPVWITLGGAAVAAGLAVTLFELGLTARNEFESGGKTDSSQRSQAVAYRTGTWVAWGIAGGLAATGVILYLVNPSPASPSTRSGAATVALDPRGVTLRLPF